MLSLVVEDAVEDRVHAEIRCGGHERPECFQRAEFRIDLKVVAGVALVIRGREDDWIQIYNVDSQAVRAGQLSDDALQIFAEESRYAGAGKIVHFLWKDTVTDPYLVLVTGSLALLPL
jgi:hypothetical protein